MRKISIGLAALAALLTLVTTAKAKEQVKLDPVRVEAFTDGIVRQAMEAQHIAGAAVAIIDRRGPVLVKGYGIAGHGRSVAAETLFRSGSISKTISWIAIMQLVEAHKLSLDDPVNAHLPADLRIPDEGFAKPILVRHLMTHSAGFEDSALGTNVTLDARRALPLREYLKRYRVHRVRPPGTMMVYSNYGAALAGAIVEHESGMDFPTYAERRVLRPLGLLTATFRDPYPAAFTRRGFPAPLDSHTAALESSGFKYAGDHFVEQTWEFLPHMAPAGGMSASARDMAVYMQALLSPERFGAAHVLQTRTAYEMRSPLMRNDDRLGANRHGFWEFPTSTGEFAFGHDGAMAFQQTFMGIYPESGIAIFVAINSARLNGGGDRPLHVALPELLAQEFIGTRPLQRASVSVAETARFAGCYRPLRRPYYRTERAMFAIAGGPCPTATGDGDLLFGNQRYIPIGHGVYSRPDRSGRIAFGWRDGRLMLFDYSSAGPSERISYFDTANWFLVIAVLTALIAAMRIFTAIVRLASRRQTGADLFIDGLSLLWIVSLLLFGVASAAWLSDFSEPLLNYPGPLLPLICWLFLAAAAGTLVGIFALWFIARRAKWNWLSWTGGVISLAVFFVFAATLERFGLLGFFGW